MKIKGGLVPWWKHFELTADDKLKLGLNIHERWKGYGPEWLGFGVVIYARRIE